MGCVSSKHIKKKIKRDILLNKGGDYVNHVVSLTSSTLGVLELDNEQQSDKEIVSELKEVKKSPPREVPPEVINAWELMKDLEEVVPIGKKSPKSRVFRDDEARSPLKFLNRSGSPKNVKKFGGKENRGGGERIWHKKSEFSPKSILRARNSSDNPNKKVLKLSYPVKSSTKGENLDFESRRRSFSPLFDPELVALYEKELSEEEEHVKMVISPPLMNNNARIQRKSQDSEATLQVFDKMSPPGRENAIVVYTTTLRGIRKTFEDCNTVRSILESHCVQMYERDVSMDSGFKEELRALMGTKEVKVPVLFVKGRIIGGVEEVVKMEEEGKLGILFNGISGAVPGCEGCGGVRFVMCMQCNGSCKVLDDQKKMVKCGECNENGLIQCPICS